MLEASNAYAAHDMREWDDGPSLGSEDGSLKPIQLASGKTCVAE